MATPDPEIDEAQQALRAVRQQQVNLVRRLFAPLPARAWLAGAAAFVLVGLARDLRGPAQWTYIAVGVAALIGLMWRARRRRARARVRVRTVWFYQQFDNRTYWIWALHDFVLYFGWLFMSGIFADAGLPWPNTIGGCVATVVYLVTGPGVRAVVRRRLIARAESGSGDGMHGFARAHSFMPVYEALDRHRRDRARAARHRAGGTGPGEL